MKTSWLIFGVLLAACSPELNWRDVTVGTLTTMLPCKPDTAQREVHLAGLRAPLTMAGCKAGGALFAVSSLPLDDSKRAENYVAAWRAQTLERMHYQKVEPWGIAPAPNGLSVMQALRVAGLDAQGSPLHARLLWLQSKQALFHIAVYGPHLDDTSLEMLTSQLRWGTGAAP